VATKVDTPDDWILVEQIRAGHHGAFRDLVRRYERQVAHLIYLSLGRPEDVEDLSQEVFLRVYHALPRLEPQRSLFSWIYRIASNVVIDEARRRKFRSMLSLDFLAAETGKDARGSTDDDPAVRTERSELHGTLQAAIRRLAPDQRVALLLREYEDLSYEEIAEVLQTSVPAVKSRLFRARQDLRSILGPMMESRT
jgi:RNA polymerase sigma-70 factor (ECF subfamily)